MRELKKDRKKLRELEKMEKVKGAGKDGKIKSCQKTGFPTHIACIAIKASTFSLDSLQLQIKIDIMHNFLGPQEPLWVPSISIPSGPKI